MPLELLISGMFLDPAAARSVGAAFLRRSGETASSERLAELLFSGLSQASARSVRDRIAERRARDFIGGDVVVVEGWVLARTEARLCAFLAAAGPGA